MKYAHLSLFSLALLAASSHAFASDASLVGCWRATKIVLYAQDGSKTQDTSGRCTLQFSDTQFDSGCTTASGRVVTTYQYRIVRPGVYLATMAGSTYKTDMVGSTREYEYRVRGDRLVTVTHPQAKAPAGAARAGRVEVEAARMACP